MFNRFIILTLFSVFVFVHAHAQDDSGKEKLRTRRDSLMTYRNTTDTNYIRKYPNRLIITLYQAYRQYDVRFSQTMATDTLGHSSPQMVADANIVTGLSIDFDKISFSFGLKSKEPTPYDIERKGRTTYKTLGLSFSLYRFRIETSFRRYKGFYDVHTGNYDTISKVFYQRPDMDVTSYRVKGLFIFNKRKFSYNAAYFNTQRQIKSAASWLAVGNLYSYRVMADSAMLPYAARPYYGMWSDMNEYHVQGIAVGPGFAFNLVLFKKLYWNLTMTSALDVQHRQMVKTDGFEKNVWKTGAAGDFRTALGINSKNFFMSITYRVDYNTYQMNNFRIEPRYNSFDFNIGYRFPFKERRWVTELKKNKWYQLL
ncbi:MAG: hypothetical protein Fur0041_21340 [Bacteroidia bacterium]